MLLVLSLCLYSGAMLVSCLIFLVRTTHLSFSMDKASAYPLGCGDPRPKQSGEELSTEGRGRGASRANGEQG